MSFNTLVSHSADQLDRKISNLARPLSAKNQEKSPGFPMRKSNTNVLTFRPTTGKPIDLHSNFRISTQRHQPTVREKLYEENLVLKTQSNLIESENIKLRTKLNQLEKNVNKREEPEFFFYKSMSKTSLVPNLKSSIKELKSKIRFKKDEIEHMRKSMKSTKMMETDVELQIYSDELTRLRYHLDAVMRDNSISYGMLEFEERLQGVAQEIEKARAKNLDYGRNLASAREELADIVEKIRNLGSPTKRKKTQKSQKQYIDRMIKEGEEILTNMRLERELFEDQKKKTFSEIETLQRQNREILETIKITENKLKEQNLIADQLKSQISNHEKEVKRSQTNILSVNSYRVRKLKDPPKLFQKIYMIINKKKMFLDIFFTLMDKNSNGIIDIDEIYNCLSMYGNKIKKKYIFEAFRLMEISGSSIPLSIIQEYYEKYEYKFIEEDSSSEEEAVVETQKKKVEKLTYKAPSGFLPEGVILPTNSVGERIIREVKMVPMVQVTELKQLILEIQKKMQKLRLGKNKLLSTVFGSDIDPDEFLTVEKLVFTLKFSPLNLNSDQDIELLCKYLVQPENKTEVPEDQIKDFKSELLKVCKKLSNLFEEWPVYSQDDLEKSLESIKHFISQNKTLILQACLEQDKKQTNSIKIFAFKDICKDLLIDPKCWEIWESELYPSDSIDYLRFLSSIYTPKTPETILINLCENLNKFFIQPESLFDIDNQGFITGENFLEGIQKINLELSVDEQLKLLDELSTNKSGKFAKVIHIAELNKKLIEKGYRLQTLSSDDEMLTPRISNS